MKSFATRTLAVALVAGLAFAAPAAAQPAQPAPAGSRTVIKTADQLPRRTYSIPGKALDFINDKGAFTALVAKAKADVEADLAAFDIQDASVEKELRSLLQTIHVLQGDFDSAIALIPSIRALETKEPERLMTGLTLESYVAAKKAAPTDKTAFLAAFKVELAKRLDPLPIAKIKDRLLAVKAQASMVNRERVEIGLGAQLDPILEANKHEVPASIAYGLITTRYVLDYGLEVLPALAEVYTARLSAAEVQTAAKPDLWTPRELALAPNSKATPVVIGIWDTGVDTSLYPANLWTNTAEKVDGNDNDNNGFVDDIHGIAFDADHAPTTSDILSLAPLSGDKDKLIGFLAAAMDMQQGIENPGVEAFRNYVNGLHDAKSISNFQDDMSLLGNYAHGTHVAGIAVAGNPFARLLYIRETFPFRAIPEKAPSVAEYRAWGKGIRDTVAYAKAANVRVINMSWRYSRGAIEQLLAAKGVGKDSQERAEISRECFAALRDALDEAMRSAPEILFVAGSGNESNDIDFGEYIPAGLRLPNLLTVGAVDGSLSPTSFTSEGKGVMLYANGYQIDSFIPGGQRVKFSGTSMSSPQVANLAAKLIAVKPSLTTEQVIDIIRRTSDPLPERPGMLVINPKKALAEVGVAH